MSKMNDLINGSVSNIDFIEPHPEYQIIHEGIYGAVVETIDEKTEVQVIDWITKEKGGHWLMNIWSVTLGGERQQLANPHKNNLGLWVYFVRQA